MKYNLKAPECAELLRLVLPRISEHGLCADPVSYAVWFEYCGGLSPEIKNEIDARLGTGEKIDSQFIESLFNRFVIDVDPEKFDAVRREMLGLMQRTEESVHEAGDQAAQLDESLNELAPQIESAGGSAELAEVVAGLGRETGKMREVNSKLRQRLDQSTEELAKLRDQLEEAKREALTDPLTALVNRKGFEIAFESALAECTDENSPICLLMLDIDHFKRVNDTYGHLLGDKVIRVVAEIVRRSIKGNDTASRFGGEEFAVLLPHTPLSGARVVAEHIRGSIEKGRIKRLDSQETIGQVTLSVGVATMRDTESMSDLISRADEALYLAKQTGRNRVCDETQSTPQEG